jgi:methylenetetrahydrofolate reductase (NADPH)
MLPVLSASQIKKFTTLCGAKIPAPMLAKLESLESDDAAATAYGIDYATQQCQELLREGVEGLHFYTLNKPHSTTAVVKNLGLAK